VIVLYGFEEILLAVGRK